MQKNEPEAALVRPAMLAGLELTATAVVGLVLAIKPLTAGQLAASCETAFTAGLTWFAAFVWVLRKALSPRFSLPRLRMFWPLAAFAACVALAVHRAWTDGNVQAAWDMGLAWAADLALFLLLADLAIDARTRRLFAAILVAGLGTVLAYSIYQRFYGMAYLHAVIEAQPRALAGMRGMDPVQQSLYHARLYSERVGGPFGYPNALAGYLVLLLGFIGAVLARSHRVTGGGTRHHPSRIAPAMLLAASLLVLVLTGSKAGFLAAKAMETALLALALPVGDRTPGRLAALVAGVCLGTTLGLACLAACQLSGHPLAGGVLLAFVWWLEVLLLGGGARRGAVPGRSVVRAGWMCALAGAAAVLLLLLGPAPDPATTARASAGGNAEHVQVPVAPRLAGRLQTEARKTLEVRWNYWIAAVRMIRAFPVRGVGLDNFGSRYTQFKTVSGWAVRRAHNHLLQLAADGGLPLAVSFALVWYCFFRLPGPRAPPAQTEKRAGIPVRASGKTGNEHRRAGKRDAPEQRVARQLRLLGILLGPAAFAIIYLLYLRGFFMGLSLEFFMNEINALPGSGAVRAATGSWLPALVHGGVHLLLLPGAWVLVCAWYYSLPATRERADILLACKAGVAGLLLHSLADFHLMHTAVSSVFWAMAGLGAAAAMPARIRLAPGKPLRAVCLLVLLLAGLVLFHRLVIPQMQGVFAVQVADVAREAYLQTRHQNKRQKAYRAALQASREAIALRPRDGALHRQLGDLLLAGLLAEARRGAGLGGAPSATDRDTRLRVRLLATLPPQARLRVLGAWRRAIACDPYFASGYACYARRELELFADDPGRVREAAAFFERACKLHPFKPVYRVELAGVYLRLRLPARARLLLQGALRLDRRITDARARLDTASKEEARRRIRLLRGLDHPRQENGK